MSTHIQTLLTHLQPHLSQVLAVNAGVQGIINFLGTLASWMALIAFALVGTVFVKAGLQWAFGGGLLGDEHSIRGAVTSMKAVIVGAIIVGCAATLTGILSVMIGNITGGTPPPIPIPTPQAGGAIFPHAAVMLHLIDKAAMHITTLIS
jgi:hypothetical protein